MGEKNSMEERMALSADLTFHAIPAGKLRRYLSLQNIVDFFKIPYAILVAFLKLGGIKPTVVFSKGGYVSVPVIIAAWLRRIPVVIHESDLSPGLATKIGKRFAATICYSWKSSARYFEGKQAVLTGVPVRDELLAGDLGRGKELFPVGDFTKPVLTVVGGSTGAKAINDLIAEHIVALTETYHIIHLTGKGKEFPLHEEGYMQLPFLEEGYGDLMALSDLILTRAGATALAEFAALGKKILMVPLTLEQSRGDQIENAKEYAAMHPESSEVLMQEDLTIDALLTALERLHKKKDTKGILSSSSETIAQILEGFGPSPTPDSTP